MTTLTGVRVDDGGVGGREVIVAAKDPVAALGVCGKGRAGDGAGLDVHGDDALGDALGDERDELRVSGCAALGQEIVEVVAARDVELVNCTVTVGFVAVRELFEGREGGQFVVPEGEHGDSQRDDQRRQHAGEALEDFGERLMLHGTS